ncbi:MAG: TonB family protein [Candidatus Aminicenantales bacterium]
MSLASLPNHDSPFQKYIILSIILHLSLFLLILLSPYFPKSSSKGMIHYVNLISLPQGGGSPPGGSKGSATALPQRETLRDLTTPQKFESRTSSTLRHPVSKPKREKKIPNKKKAVIQKQAQALSGQSKEKPAASSGVGSGVRLGIGSGQGAGSGFQSSYSSQIGLASFPYTYYLQIIMDKVSNNWFTSLVEPGLRGKFQVTVYFKIYKSGHISDLKIEESSGLRSLDLSALRAIQTSTPFPPLPKEYDEEYLGIHLIFEHSK